MYIIYSIIDRRDGLVRYIGVTKNKLQSRLSAHISAPITDYFRQIDIQPVIEEIETVQNEEEAAWLEQFWVEQMRQWGFTLSNQANTVRYVDHGIRRRLHHEPATEILSFRLTAEDKDILTRLAESMDGISETQTVRRLIRKQAKILGIT